MTFIPHITHSEGRLLRLSQVIGPDGFLPISKSAFYAGIKEGRYPSPIKLSPRVSAWRANEIEALIVSLAAQRASS